MLFRLGVLAIGVLALLLRLWAPGPTTQTHDEDLWMQRSDSFSRALADGHFSKATAIGGDDKVRVPTMPGVTTMWAGVLGKAVAHASGAVGLSASPEEPDWKSPQVLRASRGVVSVVTVAMLLVFILALRRLFGRVVALVTGGLLAVEPWLVGHSALLHTDAMVTMFSAVSVVALAVSVTPGDSRGVSSGHLGAISSPHWFWISAITGALALLTKLNSIGILLPGVLVVLVCQGVRGKRPANGFPATRVILQWTGIVVATAIVAWPALWASTMTQLDGLLANPGQGFMDRPVFFHGRTVTDAGPLFYPVALAFRSTVWLFLLMLLGLIGGLFRLVLGVAKRNRPAELIPSGAAWLVATTLPYLAVLTITSNKYDRYVLPVEPLLLTAGVLVVVGVLRTAAQRLRPEAGQVLAFGAGTVFVLVLVAGSASTIASAPYAIDYVSPVLGGQPTAVKWIPLGWGETTAVLGRRIADEENGRCDDVRVAVPIALRVAMPCGELVVPKKRSDLEDVDYVVTDVTFGQVSSTRWYSDWAADHGDLIDEVSIDGVIYSRLWRLRHER